MRTFRNPITVTCFLTCVLTLVLTSLIGSHAQNNAATIYGCAKNSNGQLRLVTNYGQCNPSETEVSWSVGNELAAQHHRELTFTLPVGQSRSIRIPKTDRPMAVNVSLLGLRVDKRDGTFENGGPQIISFIATYESATGLWNTEALNPDPKGIGLTQISVHANPASDELVFGSGTQQSDNSTPILVGDITYRVSISY